MKVEVLLTSALRATEDRSFRSFNILLTKLHSILVRLKPRANLRAIFKYFIEAYVELVARTLIDGHSDFPT
jgi:hypothetical protein